MLKNWFLSWGMLVVSVVFNALGASVIKWKLNEVGKIEFHSFQKLIEYALIFLRSPVVVISVLLFFASPFLFAVALSRLPLTMAYPVQIGLNFLLVLAVSVLFLNEKVSVVQWVGIGLIMCGVIILNKP